MILRLDKPPPADDFGTTVEMDFEARVHKCLRCGEPNTVSLIEKLQGYNCDSCAMTPRSDPKARKL